MGRDRYSGVPVVSHSSQNTSQMASTDIAPAAMKYNVYVRNPSGKLVTVEQFDSLEEAQQFKHDFEAAQSSPNGNDLNVVQTSNKF
jgi:hypothetical protein